MRSDDDNKQQSCWWQRFNENVKIVEVEGTIAGLVLVPSERRRSSVLVRGWDVFLSCGAVRTRSVQACVQEANVKTDDS